MLQLIKERSHTLSGGFLHSKPHRLLQILLSPHRNVHGYEPKVVEVLLVRILLRLKLRPRCLRWHGSPQIRSNVALRSRSRYDLRQTRKRDYIPSPGGPLLRLHLLRLLLLLAPRFRQSLAPVHVLCHHRCSPQGIEPQRELARRHLLQQSNCLPDCRARCRSRNILPLRVGEVRKVWT